MILQLVNHYNVTLYTTVTIFIGQHWALWLTKMFVNIRISTTGKSLVLISQQNYLAKTDLDVSIFLHENPVFMSVWVVMMSVQVMVIPSGIITTWMEWYHHNLDGHHHNRDGHKDGIFTEKYGAVQVRFGEAVLLCTY